MHIGLRLVDTNTKIRQDMLNAIAKHLTKTLSKAYANIITQIRKMTIQHLRSTETYEALAGGVLEGHFGFPKGTGVDKADAIIESVAKGIQIVTTPVTVHGNKFRGELTVQVLRKNLDEVFRLGNSILMTFNKGELLPWADWLLRRGNDIIIKQYEISWESGRGRSGQAIMIPDDSGFWQVPPEYAGTVNDNWLTRSILRETDGYVQKLHSIIIKEISRLI